MDSKKIGKVIAKRRKEKRMTQGELAERLSVSNKTISKWETGAGLPDISILVDLASVLDISVDDLLKGKENKVQNTLYEKNFLIKKKYYKKYMKKMHMICKMEEKRVKYMCFGTNDVL